MIIHACLILWCTINLYKLSSIRSLQESDMMTSKVLTDILSCKTIKSMKLFVWKYFLNNHWFDSVNITNSKMLLNYQMLFYMIKISWKLKSYPNAGHKCILNWNIFLYSFKRKTSKLSFSHVVFNIESSILFWSSCRYLLALVLQDMSQLTMLWTSEYLYVWAIMV